MAKRTQKVAAVRRASGTLRNGVYVDGEGFEILGGGQGLAIGETHVGVYGGVARKLKPLRKGGEATPVYQIGARQLLGNAALRGRIEDGNVKVGDTLKVTRLADGVAKKGQSAPKLFEVGIKRAGKRAGVRS